MDRDKLRKFLEDKIRYELNNVALAQREVSIAEARVEALRDLLQQLDNGIIDGHKTQ